MVEFEHVLQFKGQLEHTVELCLKNPELHWVQNIDAPTPTQVSQLVILHFRHVPELT